MTWLTSMGRIGALAIGVLVASAGLAQGKLDLQLLEIDLPGPPVEVFASDLDGDGLGDLLVLVAYTTWDQITISEQVEDDEVEGLIEMMTIVPALADRRQLFFLRGSKSGGFIPVGGGLPVPREISAFLPGPSTASVLAIDDEGLLAVRLNSTDVDGELGSVNAGDSESQGTIVYERLLSQPTILTGGGSLLPRLPLTADIDGDGELDLLLPLQDRFSIFLGSDPGFAGGGDSLKVAGQVFLPGREKLQISPRKMHYPLPRLEDLNGDGLPELILTHPTRRVSDPWIAENTGGGFGPLRRPLKDSATRVVDQGNREGGRKKGVIVFLGDVDGDGHAEFVDQQSLADEDAGFRSEMRTAKVPTFRYRVFSTDSDFSLLKQHGSFEAKGYAFGADSGSEFPLPGGFQDLDGDGRLDLVTITLDFSMMQLVRIMVTQSISIGLDFHILCQKADGGFQRVSGLDLSGKFKIRLNDLRLGQLSQFAGDFDGDGRADFVQIGRGRKVSIHRGAKGCVYPSRPDLSFELEAEPKNLSLVRVGDFDGDGLADLWVVHPRRGRGRAKAASDASTLPVTLEMHLSRRGKS